MKSKTMRARTVYNKAFIFMFLALSCVLTACGQPKDPVYTLDQLDKAPMMPGGPKAVVSYLFTGIRYPEKALADETEGVVLVGFVVTKDSLIKDVEIKERVSPELDKEALRLITEMPKWRPGIKDGHYVSSYIYMPVVFRIEGRPKTEEQPTDSFILLNDGFTNWAEEVPDDPPPTQDDMYDPEVYPSFPGGPKAMQAFIQKNKRQLPDVIKNKVTRTVKIDVEIKPDGSYGLARMNFDIPSYGSKEEAIRIMKAMPKWKPGMIKGKPATIRTHVTIQFP